MREILIEIGANLMMAAVRRNPQHYITLVRFHHVVLTLDALLFHFMPHGSMRR